MKGKEMKSHIVAGVLLAISATIPMNSATAAGVDAEAAKKLAKANSCLSCHAVDKSKMGPSYKKIAAKYKGKADAEAILLKQITSAPKFKLDDGTEVTHKVIDTKDQGELKNLVGWILSQ
jgi:cytochrome c